MEDLVSKNGANKDALTWTMVGSCLLPSTNSSYVSLASLSLSIFLNILSTRYTRVLDAGVDDENLVKLCLFWGILVCREFHHLPCHPVYGLDDLKHLVVCDGAVFIYIV